MRIVFMGSPDFAIPSLEKLHQSDHEIISVVSNIDKRRGRRAKPSPTPLKAKALELGLPVIGVEDLGADDFYEELKALEADLFVVVAFRILPPRLLELPSKGSVNLHASLLPKYRGAAPIHWAVIEGEKQTGCSIFFLDEKVDTGNIIKQQTTPIGRNETTGEVYNRLKKMGSDLLVEAVEEIDQDSYTTTPQNHEEATPAPKLFKEDCKIDFDHPAEQIHNKIRGLSPFPTAWATLDGQKFNIYRSQLGPDKSVEVGKLVMEGEHLLVGCKRGTVILKKVQLQGKKRMSGKDFMNGYHGQGKLE
ncbi:methionyl-tRNA formyltransferase [Fodinibius salsisoli]|uniref:Methionyl-tRNA formyltransferase n=1 Tax=Fodinibius salsisoli TaxID=2820877 RepID=A0ABT3PQ61_9BACT|nr:methionyl-tRNA formyltransferase [Fodinibius salsisoli]MCW9708003.1 methionyl-tRNA formyltransferase [Fodinibius salsisoli]